jgi:hypothetical protein
MNKGWLAVLADILGLDLVTAVLREWKIGSCRKKSPH